MEIAVLTDNKGQVHLFNSHHIVEMVFIPPQEYRQGVPEEKTWMDVVLSNGTTIRCKPSLQLMSQYLQEKVQ